MESLIEILRNNKLKITPRRLAVLELFYQERKLLTPEQIWQRLNSKFNKLGMPTIYRILAQLSQIRILRQTTDEQQQLCYYYCSLRNKNPHHHFYCKNCQRVFCLEFCELDSIKKAVAGQIDAEVHHHELYIEGLCSECRKSTNNAKLKSKN